MKTPLPFNRQNRGLSRLRIATAVTLMLTAVALAIVPSVDTLVTNGSPITPFSQNKQNEPAIAVDANHPNILVAGVNDQIDLEACNAGNDTDCPFTAGVGTSGVYFSFDSGHTWTQPTYTGWTARDCLGIVGPDPGCTPHVGSIGTVPNYFEAGLVSQGDPAVAFGPRRGANGKFSWANGSRLYYANLVSNFTTGAFKGFSAVAVSRTDDVATAAQGGVTGKNAWKAPIIASKQSSSTFSDKDQIWADNAASSPFFGNVYVCSSAFRGVVAGNGNGSVPLVVAVSSDGGNTWTSQQVTSATSNAQHGFQTGCTIRTDSHGVVYVAVANFVAGNPGIGSHVLVKSSDGGKSWTNPVSITKMNDACYNVDPVFNECTEDGIAGARSDLSAAPALSIANGAPTGVGATNEIFDAWVDGRVPGLGVTSNGFNHEVVLLRYSLNGGSSWTGPVVVNSLTPGDRGFYAAPAISPNGGDLYVVYNAFTTPFRSNTTNSRTLVGVVKHAAITGGVPGAFGELHRGAAGDARGASSNDLTAEFLGDYVYAAATNTYVAAVWNDVRNAADCPAVDTYRQSVQNGTPGPVPAPEQDCPATFGNSDIFGGSYPP